MIIDLPEPVFVVEEPKPPKALGCVVLFCWPKPPLPKPPVPKDMMVLN